MSLCHLICPPCSPLQKGLSVWDGTRSDIQHFIMKYHSGIINTPQSPPTYQTSTKVLEIMLLCHLICPPSSPPQKGLSVWEGTRSDMQHFIMKYNSGIINTHHIPNFHQGIGHIFIVDVHNQIRIVCFQSSKISVINAHPNIYLNYSYFFNLIQTNIWVLYKKTLFATCY